MPLRGSTAAAWIPGLRSTPPGMTGWFVGPPQVARSRHQPMAPLLVIPAEAGIHMPLRGSTAEAWIPGLRFTPPGMTATGRRSAQDGRSRHWPTAPLPRHSRGSGNPNTSAWINCRSLDSGSPFHSARNDGMVRGPLKLRGACISQRPRFLVIPAEAGIHKPLRGSSAGAWIPGLRFTPPGMTGWCEVRSRWAESALANGHAPSSFPRKRESKYLCMDQLPQHGFRVSASLRPE